MQCDNCGDAMIRRKATISEPYNHTLSEVDNVYLANIEVYTCPHCKCESPVLPHVGEPHEVVVQSLLTKVDALTKPELRFISKHKGVHVNRLFDDFGKAEEDTTILLIFDPAQNTWVII